MAPKQLLLIGAGTAVVGGGATGAYFLIPEKKEATVESEGSGEVVKNTTSLRESLTGVTFLKTNDNTNNDTWGKLVDKFHELSSSNKAKIKASIASKVETPSNKDANIEVLKKACDELLIKTDFQESDKNIAKDWCSSNTTLLTEVGPDSAARPLVGS